MGEKICQPGGIVDVSLAARGPSLGPVLPGILDRYWAVAPHHLQLALMHATSMSARGLTEEHRKLLIDTIERLLPGNGAADLTGMIDALKYLGHSTTIRRTMSLPPKRKSVLPSPTAIIRCCGSWPLDCGIRNSITPTMAPIAKPGTILQPRTGKLFF